LATWQQSVSFDKTLTKTTPYQSRKIGIWGALMGFPCLLLMFILTSTLWKTNFKNP
jgi:hypothetical protein